MICHSSYSSRFPVFLNITKDMEESKRIKIEGWEDRETAHREILSSIEHFNKAPSSPASNTAR